MKDTETYVEITKRFISNFSDVYNYFLDLMYKESFLENPEAFILSSKTNIDAYIIKCNKRVFYSNFVIMFYQGEGKIEYIGEIQDNLYSKVKNYHNEKDFFHMVISQKIKPGKFYFSETIWLDLIVDRMTESSVSMDKAYKMVHNSVWESSYSTKIYRQVKEDGEQFIDHINKENSYYAKDAYKYTYSELNFEEIMKVVENNDFEYALNESIAAYDNSLFLAATVTAGVALENLLVVILEKENITIGENDATELGVLSNKLLKNNIIDKREKNRIMLAAKYRNLASHANKGRVTRNDSKTIYTEIFNLASSYFEI